MNNLDKRAGSTTSIKLKENFFPLDIHKSMFFKELRIQIPVYYKKQNWKKSDIISHNVKNYKWDAVINYRTPKKYGQEWLKFNGKIILAFSKNRTVNSNYKLSWQKDFALQLANDYPKSYVRSLEYHIGHKDYKKLKFSEFDIGGFKEQLMVKVEWINEIPNVEIKEYFRIGEHEHDFPNLFHSLGDYLIAEYLDSSKDELLRRVRVSKWKKRKELNKEMHENNIYLLLNRENKEIYFGETKKSLSSRYPDGESHHSFPDWQEYCIIELPPGTSNDTRQLIERVLIEAGAKIFKNNFNSQSIDGKERSIKLVNKRK